MATREKVERLISALKFQQDYQLQLRYLLDYPLEEPLVEDVMAEWIAKCERRWPGVKDGIAATLSDFSDEEADQLYALCTKPAMQKFLSPLVRRKLISAMMTPLLEAPRQIH